MDYTKLEDYGIIGDLNTCALISKYGSIDWYCIPHIESPSVFARILDVGKGGYFQVQPKNRYKAEQEYIYNTNVLKTVFKTTRGEATLTDFMPIATNKNHSSIILRKIDCIRGAMGFKITFYPKFNYAQNNTTYQREGSTVIAAAGQEKLYLHTSNNFKNNNSEVHSELHVKEGDVFWLCLQNKNGEYNPQVYENLLTQTQDFWLTWVHKCEKEDCVVEGPWHDLVVRSSLVLKLLTRQATGAICAAPTTSLPEAIGGARNWDYRYTWIRDASFTVQALYNLGYVAEARNFLNWFKNICLKNRDTANIQIMYGMHGETCPEERELTHLSGYKNSRPVRIGNGAAKQRQLDIYGELINAMYETTRYGEDVSAEDWELIKRIIDYVCEVWKTKDAGIWEIRGEPAHFTYSKVMCWVAIDRGIKIAETLGYDAPLGKWQKYKSTIKTTVLEKCFNNKLNTFVQTYESEVLDATSLLFPLLGFISYNDPKVQGTIAATMKHLISKDGFVYRYQGNDGLDGEEGAFVLCTCWLVDVLTLSGRIEEAERIFNTILAYVNPLGLLSEEIDTKTGLQMGNFPQAFSHIGLINSALYLGIARGKQQMGPQPLGAGVKPKTSWLRRILNLSGKE